MQQPVGIQLGEARKQVYDAQLRAEGPGHPHGDRVPPPRGPPPGVQRGRAVQRHEDHQEADQAHPVVVVQIGRLVDELDVGEEDEEGRHGEAVAIAQRHAQAGRAEQGKVEIHAPGRPGLHPLEAEIFEVTCGLDVELGDPAVGGEAADGEEAEEPEGDAKGGGRGGADPAGSGQQGAVEGGRKRRRAHQACEGVEKWPQLEFQMLTPIPTFPLSGGRSSSRGFLQIRVTGGGFLDGAVDRARREIRVDHAEVVAGVVGPKGGEGPAEVPDAEHADPGPFTQADNGRRRRSRRPAAAPRRGATGTARLRDRAARRSSRRR